MIIPMLTGIKVFPAYAGVILSSNRIMISVISVPRVCGGDPSSRSIERNK